MESQLEEQCLNAYNRMTMNVHDCLDRAREMHHRGLQDLKAAVTTLESYRHNTSRLYSRETMRNLKRCQVYLCVRVFTSASCEYVYVY